MAYFNRYAPLVDAQAPEAFRELESYSRRLRLGDFHGANELWDDSSLHDSTSFFVIATRAEGLLRQNAYGKANDYLDLVFERRAIDFTAGQSKLLSAIHAYCEIFTKGFLRRALIKARDIRSWLSTILYQEYDAIEIAAVEYYLNIVKYAFTTSTFTNPTDRSFPFDDSAEEGDPFSSFDRWIHHLLDRKALWESLTVIKILGVLQPLDLRLAYHQKLLKALKGSPLSESTFIVAVAGTISASKVAILAKQPEEAKRLLSSSQDQIKDFENKYDQQMRRQNIEQQLANLEFDSINMDIESRVQSYDRIAETCKQNDEFGLEEVCMDEVASLAVQHNRHEDLNARQARLQYVQKTLQRDIPATLRSRCRLWRAQSDENTGSMLAFFQTIEKVHPLAEFLKGSEEEDAPEYRKWDVPAVRLRVEGLKFQMYRNLQDLSAAKEALQTAHALKRWTPPITAVDMEEGGRITMEWWQSSKAGVVPPEEVILNRFRMQFGSRDPSEQEIRLLTIIFSNSGDPKSTILPPSWKSMDSAELRKIIFPTPMVQETFEARLKALQDIFLGETLFDRNATQYLIAQLLCIRPNFPTAKNDVQDNVVAQKRFVDYVASISNESIRRELRQNVLRAKENRISTTLEWIPDLTVEDYIELQAEVNELLNDYEGSPMARNYTRIATIHAAKAEITLRARQDRSYFEEFQRQYAIAETYLDEMRSELSALPPEQALRVKTLSRVDIVAGTKEPLSRIIDLLVNEYLQQRWRYAVDSKKYAFEIWDQIQRRKSRALNDMMSSGNHLPDQLVDQIKKEPNSKRLYDRWRSQLGVLSDAKINLHNDPATIDSARRKLDTCEKEMKQDQLLLPIVEICKGKAATATDMAKLFTGYSQGIILVDYFIAHISMAPKKLCIIIYRVAPEVLPPVILQLQMDIGFGVQRWTDTYLQKAGSGDRLKTPAAYKELQNLNGLVQPLAVYSKPGDLLVLCPTTAWNIHRVPLHAIEIKPQIQQTALPGGNAPKPGPTLEERLLLLRNKIIYTNSHSLLRLSMNSRTAKPATSLATNWKPAFFSPLSSGPGDEDEIEIDRFANLGGSSLDAAISPKITPRQRQDIKTATETLGRFLGALPYSSSTEESKLLYSASKEVTHQEFVQRSKEANFLFFLGHVHPVRPPTPALSSHLLLYVPNDDNEICTPGEIPHRPEAHLTGKAILEECLTAEGSHVVMLSCHGAVMEPGRAIDEPLGLIPAFFAAGARSVTAALWAVDVDDACEWTRRLEMEWRRQQRQESVQGEKGATTPPTAAAPPSLIDLASIFQAASISMLHFRSVNNLKSWGSFVFHGYWMYPPVDYH